MDFATYPIDVLSTATYRFNMSQKSKNNNLSPKQWQPEKPYQELPLLPPKGVDLESKPILKKCILARVELAQLKKAAELIPNQSVLILLLPKLEARASSEIENIVTTMDKLFQYGQVEEQADPATKEAVRYSQALLEGFRQLAKNPLTTRTLEKICTTIKGVDMTIRKVPGTQLVNDRTKKIIYTPPDSETLLRDLFKNWEDFTHDTSDIDPLIKMAVAHYQFEAIHPFTDGNGRTGRILNSLFLIESDLLNLPILYLSRFLIQHRDEYYRLLLAVTKDHEWEKWILFMLEAVEQTAKWTREKVEAIRDLMTQTSDFIQKNAPKAYSYELVNLIFDLPYCRIQDITDKKIAGRQAASRYLKELVQIGTLEEQTFGRGKVFVHRKLLNLLKSDSAESPLGARPLIDP